MNNNSAVVIPVYLPRGVADPGKGQGYFTEDFRRIEALDLLTGSVLWGADAPGRPLMVSGDRLAILQIVQGATNQLRVIALDRFDGGKLLFTSGPIIFPEWSAVTLFPGDCFAYEVFADGDDLILGWRASAAYDGGAPPPPHILARYHKSDAGIVRIDLRSGEIRMLPPEVGAEPQLPEGLRQAVMFSYRTAASASWRSEPWALRGKRAAIVGEVRAGQQRLQLQKWSDATGELDEPIPLTEGRALVAHVTPDGEYIFVHSEATAATSPESAARPPWLVYSAGDGGLVAELSYEPGAREPCVIDSRVYYLVVETTPAVPGRGAFIRQRLKAGLLPSGESLWEYLLSEQQVKPPPKLRP